MALSVSDVMHRGVVVCDPATPLGEAAALLVRHRVHAVVVAHDDGRPLGILADSDLLAGEWLSTDAERLEAMRAMTAGDLMTEGVLTIEVDAPVAEAAARMWREGVARLVVAEGGLPVGVVSVSDLVACLARAALARGTVADVMSRAFVACLPDTPASALARAMTERRSRSVVVLDRLGAAVGVVTGTDLLPLVESGDLSRTASELMHAPIAIGPEATLSEAAEALVRAGIHRLIVVDPADSEGLPLGILSTSDVLVEMAEPGSAWR